MKAFNTMLKTELKISIRDMNMIIFALFVPVVVTVILGIIYGTNPASPGADYSFMAQSFGALSVIAICAGGVMGLPLVVSDYRHKKILKRFRVTPVSPVMILAVQVAIYAIYSIASLILVFATATLFFGYSMIGSIPYFLGGYFLIMLSMFSIGMMVGGVASNQKIASVI
jgi:ABC-2 type transport system permease protein